MSLDAMTWAYAQKPSTPIQKFVLVTLGDRSNDAGIVWVSRRYLAEKCSASMSAVKRALDALEEGGFIRRRKRDRENGSASSNVIILAPLWPDRSPLVPAAEDDLPVGIEMDTIDAIIKLTGVGPERTHLGPERTQGGSGENPPDPKEGSHKDPNNDSSADSAEMKLMNVPSEKVTPKWCLDTYNEIFGTRLRSAKFLRAIATRIKEYPELTRAEHRAVMETVEKQSWWRDRGAHNPNIVYGPTAFAKALDESQRGSRAARVNSKEYVGRSGRVYRDKRSALQMDDLQPGDNWNGMRGSA